MADLEEANIVKRALTLLGRGILTLGVAGIAAAAVVFGVALLNDRAAAVPEPDSAPAVPVQVETVVFEDSYSVPRRFIGQIEARSNTSLSFELSGRLEALLVKEGELVKANQEIARLDTDLLHAEAVRLKAARAASVAQLTYAEAQLERASRLQKQGFTSQNSLDQALAARDELMNRIAETDAALQSVSINLTKSVLYAPVSGRVAAQSVDLGETVQTGQQIVAVMETEKPELRVGLPLNVHPEDLAAVEIEVSGQSLSASFKTVRPDIDPVTRTRTALFDIAQTENILFGQTATLMFDTEVAARGAWVPLDALQSGKGSVWTVMVVSEGVLKRAAVEVLHVDGARAFVHGTLEDGDQIVVSGGHRIVAGQTVRVLGVEG